MQGDTKDTGIHSSEGSGSCSLSTGVFCFVALAVLLILPRANAQGVRWTYRYNGPGNSDDWARTLKTGPDTNLYAAGFSTGNSTGRDVTIISLARNHNIRWTYRYTGASGVHNDEATSVSFGADGSVYVAANSSGVGDTSLRFTVLSLTPSGSLRWLYRDSNPGGTSTSSSASQVTNGDDGYVYAVGRKYLTSGTSLFYVASLTPDGRLRWDIGHVGTAHRSNYGSCIVYGPDGNLYSGGCLPETASSFQPRLAIVSHTTSGDPRWTYRCDRGGFANSIVYGADQNIYAAGGVASYPSYKFGMVSVTTEGSERWVYESPITGGRAYGLVYGDDGNIYASGNVGSDFAVVSVDANGNERWTYRDSSSGGSATAKSLAYGPDGRIYAAGYTERGTSGDCDLTVVCLDTCGSECWAYRYAGPGGGSGNGADALVWNSPSFVDRQLSGSMLPFVLGRAEVA